MQQMKISTRTKPRVGDRPRRRRRKKQPNAETRLRVEWLKWLVEKYGADAVSEWEESPVSFEAWKRDRELSAHEAA